MCDTPGNLLWFLNKAQDSSSARSCLPLSLPLLSQAAALAPPRVLMHSTASARPDPRLALGRFIPQEELPAHTPGGRAAAASLAGTHQNPSMPREEDSAVSFPVTPSMQGRPDPTTALDLNTYLCTGSVPLCVCAHVFICKHTGTYLIHTPCACVFIQICTCMQTHTYVWKYAHTWKYTHAPFLSLGHADVLGTPR